MFSGVIGKKLNSIIAISGTCVKSQGLSCSISKTHRGKGLKPLVTELSGKSLCNLNVRQLIPTLKESCKLQLDSHIAKRLNSYE
jgi:hypothetical protein